MQTDMKVWLLLSRLAHGGLERVQLNLAQGMHERGVSVSVVAGQVIASIENALPSTIPIIEISKTGPSGFALGLLRALRHNPPDVVFTTSNDVACIVLLLRPLLNQKLRVVVTQHLSLSGPRRAAHGLKRIKLELIRIAMRVLLPHADDVVAVSQGVADDMRQDLSFEGARITVIHNPIVTRDFDARVLGASIWPWPDHSAPTIIFVGRLSQEKRLDLLLHSFSNLIRRVPARLLIVGTGPMEAEVVSRIREEELDACCKLTGFCSNPLPLMHASKVLVLPSDYEGFGNVLVEAMGCGVQVIATDCPYGPAEILENGKYGQLIPMGDSTSLTEALIRSLSGSFHVLPATLKQRASEFTLEEATHRYMATLVR